MEALTVHPAERRATLLAERDRNGVNLYNDLRSVGRMGRGDMWKTIGTAMILALAAAWICAMIRDIGIKATAVIIGEAILLIGWMATAAVLIAIG